MLPRSLTPVRLPRHSLDIDVLTSPDGATANEDKGIFLALPRNVNQMGVERENFWGSRRKHEIDEAVHGKWLRTIDIGNEQSCGTITLIA